MNATRQPVLVLYKQLLRESYKFSFYSYRVYFLRRIRDEFRQNRNLQDSSKITDLLKRGKDNLAVIQRQVIIGNLYSTGQDSIIEHQQHLAAAAAK